MIRGIELLGSVLFDTGGFFGHDLTEDEIYKIQYLGSGSVIHIQKEEFACCIPGLKILHLPVEHLRIC